MYGVVRNMTKNQHGRLRRLPLNPNKRKITTTSSPASQAEAGSGWIEKLRRSRIFASVVGSLVGSAATFQYMSIATAKAKAQEKPVKKLTCFEKKIDFPFDEKDLIDDQSIRQLYERWLTKYGVTRHPDEKEEHYQAFKDNAYHMYFFNKLRHTDCLLSLDHFGDMTDQEWEDINPPIQFSGPSDPLLIALQASMQRYASMEQYASMQQEGGDKKN